MRWAGHVTCTRETEQLDLESSWEQIAWDDNINMDLRNTGSECVDSTKLAQDTVQRRTFENTMIKLRVL
jgi:hypothetical protein